MEMCRRCIEVRTIVDDHKNCDKGRCNKRKRRCNARREHVSQAARGKMKDLAGGDWLPFGTNWVVLGRGAMGHLPSCLRRARKRWAAKLGRHG